MEKIKSIDLNCDMGEGMPDDALLMPLISSANIACGFHAGNKETMKRTVDLALEHQVAIGAHPSFQDKVNFGRTDWIDITMKPEDLPSLLMDQLVGLLEICKRMGAALHHIKPHGALYNRAARDRMVSAFICSAIRDFDPGIILYGLSGSQMMAAAQAIGLKFCAEGFADRSYQDDGSLTPRIMHHALLQRPEQAAAQALLMAKESCVLTVSCNRISMPVETICLHSDGPRALEFATRIRKALLEEGIAITPPA